MAPLSPCCTPTNASACFNSRQKSLKDWKLRIFTAKNKYWEYWRPRIDIENIDKNKRCFGGTLCLPITCKLNLTRLGQLNQSKSFKTSYSNSIPASLPHLKDNDCIPAGAKNGQFCEGGDVYWRRDARYSNHRTFKCTSAQIRPYVRTVEHSDICRDLSSLAQNIVSKM